MINKDTVVAEILRKKPEAQQVFHRHGLPCMGWGSALYESIGQAAQEHHIDIDKLMKDLHDLGL